MAKIIKMSDKLNEQYTHYRKKSIFWFIMVGVFFVTFAVLGPIITQKTFSTVGMLPIMGMFLFSGFMGGRANQKANSYKAGVEGEAATASIVASLPQSFVGIMNLDIVYEGKSSELDLVIVGPTGVYIVETKNMNGTIVGHVDNPQWVQKKIGQKGTPYSKNFYSPVKQVGTHVYRLAHLLRDNRFNVHVNSFVYFANPDAVVQIVGQNPNIPVLNSIANGGSDILRLITNQPQCLSNEQVNGIVSFLCGKNAPVGAAAPMAMTTQAPVMRSSTQPTPAAPPKAHAPAVQKPAQPVTAPVIPPVISSSGAAQQSINTNFCSKCGSKLQSGAVFCAVCGNKVK